MTLVQTLTLPLYRIGGMFKKSSNKQSFLQDINKQFLSTSENHSSETGQVVILGAGPGDAELMTIKGYKALQSAEVVLFDWLVSEDVLRMIPSHVNKEFVGKRCGKHSMPQASICQLMLKHALAGKRVVRLKGGDPAIFARTLEETKLLAQHNIPFCIIPGITAASGASAYTGLTLTHRECAQSVRFVTASLQNVEDEPNWQKLSSNCESETLVFYMGLSKVALISQRLKQSGLAPDFPICIIDNACQTKQKLVIGTISDIADNPELASLTGPALIVVGRVIEHFCPVTMNPFSMSPIASQTA